LLVYTFIILRHFSIFFACYLSSCRFSLQRFVTSSLSFFACYIYFVYPEYLISIPIPGFDLLGCFVFVSFSTLWINLILFLWFIFFFITFGHSLLLYFHLILLFVFIFPLVLHYLLCCPFSSNLFKFLLLWKSSLHL
jgi:hypothetical protein